MKGYMSMKRTVLILTALILAVFTLPGCVLPGKADTKTTVGRRVELDLSEASVQTDRDTHGGFHGDGVWFVQLDCSARPLADEIAANPHWKPLPASDNVAILLYGGEKAGSGYAPVVKIDDHDSGVYDQPLFPEVENGYYFFFDRHDGVKDPYNDVSVLNRASYNFTVAVYDADADTLCFCEVDT